MNTFGRRRMRLEAALPESVDGLLVTKAVNVRYLTGFASSNSALLVARDQDPVLATDGRYLTQAAEQVPEIECINAQSVVAELAARAAADGIRRLGFESHHLTVAVHSRLAAAAGDATHLEALVGIVEDLRVVKDEAEIASLVRACEITDAMFDSMLGALQVGVTEQGIAWALEQLSRDHSAEGLAFDPIVAFGPNSAIPHHAPSDRPLARGDLVKADFGALYGGYHADMTRTVVFGSPAAWQQEIHAAVLAVQSAARSLAVDGAVPRDLDASARHDLEAAGYAVMHGLGHGVGLEIHEAPFLTLNSPAPPLADGVPVTIEPGIYLPGRGGVRIEDTCVVGRGSARSLTCSPRELLDVA